MWHSLPIEEVLKKLNTSNKGLDDYEAERRLKIYGENKIRLEKKNFIEIVIEYLKNPFLLLFLVADILSIIFGGITEGSAITLFLILYIISDYLHDKKSEKIIKSLEENIESNVLVIRNGKYKYVKSSKIVPGDIIVLKYGQRAPADIRIIESIDLEVDESSLTGESEPVKKYNTILPKDIPVKERKNMIFQNSYIIKGIAIGVVVETGNNTYYGSIYKNISKQRRDKSLLQEELDKFSYYMIIIISIIVIVSFVILLIKNILNLYQLIIFVIALAIVVIPEGLPAALVLIYTISSQKLERDHIYIKDPNILEDVSNIDTVVLDKTGTITYNELVINKFFYNGKFYNIKYYKDKAEIIYNKKIININDVREFLIFLYNSIEDYLTIDIEKNAGDPINLSIYRLTKYFKISEFLERYSINYFDPYRKRSSVIVKYNDKKYAIIKGSPSSLLSISKYIIINNKVFRIDKYKEKIEKIEKEYGKKGYRILAIGIKEIEKNEESEKDITFLGLLFIKDKIREGILKYIKELEDLGINIYIVTGDNKDHTLGILRLLNLNYKIIDANEIKKLNENYLYKILRDYHVIVNADPLDKYRIVKTLKDKGHRVLFVGDGTNDAIALKISNVGVSFYNASDIAKDSANVILMDKGIDNITKLIMEGKRIIYNLKVYILVMLSELLGIFLFILIGFFIYNQIFLQALQLLLLNLVIETINSLYMGSSDVKDKKILKKMKVKIFDRSTKLEIIRNMIFIGLTSTIVALATNDNSYIIILFLIATQGILYIHYEKLFSLNITKTKEYYISIFLSTFITSIFLIGYLRKIVQFIIPSLIDIAVFAIVSLYFFFIYSVIERVENVRGI
jgi:magnesium-transporting ATPase (P-type)